MNNDYKIEHKIKLSEVDENYHMRLDHVMTHFQNITGLHSFEMEIDGKTMQEKSNAFWVISKMKVKIHSMPQFEETVTIETWPTFAKGVRFGRDYTICNENQLLVSCSSEWCTLDCDTKRPRRVESVHYPHDMLHRQDRSNAGDFLQAKESVCDADYNHTHKVVLTDIDVNQHTNNIAYIRMALDCFSLEEFGDLHIDEMQISYITQSYYGDQVTLYKKQTDYGYYIEGLCDDKTIFRYVMLCK